MQSILRNFASAELAPYGASCQRSASACNFRRWAPDASPMPSNAEHLLLATDGGVANGNARMAVAVSWHWVPSSWPWGSLALGLGAIPAASSSRLGRAAGPRPPCRGRLRAVPPWCQTAMRQLEQAILFSVDAWDINRPRHALCESANPRASRRTRRAARRACSEVARLVPVRCAGSSIQFRTAMAMLAATRTANRMTNRYFHSWSGVPSPATAMPIVVAFSDREAHRGRGHAIGFRQHRQDRLGAEQVDHRQEGDETDEQRAGKGA